MSDNGSDKSAVTLRDKIEKYLNTHKKPVTVKALSDRFLASPTAVRRALTQITGLVIVSIGLTNWYRRKQ